MEHKETELQIETGSYTRIVNRVVEELVKLPFKGIELAVCLFIIRKTWGYQKLEDEISLSQFEEGLARTKPTIIKALKNLQLVNILILVKKGNSRQSSNVWRFNKYFKTWDLVKGSIPEKGQQLVKKTMRTSKESAQKLVKGSIHTIDNTKETKEIVAKATGKSIKKKKEDGPFEYQVELKKLRDGPDRACKVIALYFLKKDYDFKNWTQWNNEFKRNLTPAHKLTGYNGEQILRTIEHCKKKYEEWTLETVERRMADLALTKT